MGMVNESLRRLWGDQHGGADFSAYLDDRLDARTRRRIDRHVERCARCRDELAAIRQTRDLLRRVRPVRAPRSFALRPSVVPTRVTLSPRLMYRNAAAAMAAMLIAVSAATLVSPPERIVPETMAEAALAQPSDARAPAALSAAAPSSAPLAQAPAARARDAAADRAVTEPNARPVVGASASAGAPPARVDAVPAKARAASGTAAKAPEIAAAARLAARDGAMRPSAAEKATESAKAAETAAGMVIAFPTDGKIAEVPWAVLIGLATLTVLSGALALRMP